MMIASLIDTFYVGQIGTVELAALTLTFPLVMGFSSLSMGFGIGATSIISRTAGAGDWIKAQRIATHTLILVIGFVSVLVVLGYVLAEPIFVLLNARDELLPIAVKYTYIVMLGVPILAVPMVGGMMLRSFNDVRTPAIIMVSGAAIQVVIAPILIWGIGPWDGYGVYGSAWSFVLSRLIVAVYALHVFRQRGFIQNPGSLSSFLTSVREVMRLALPSMATQALMPLSMYLIMMLVAQYENYVVAAYGVVTRLEALAMMVIMALTSSLGPFVGQNFGAKRIDRVQAALKMCMSFCMLWGLLVAVVFFLWGGSLAGAFRDDPEVIRVATQFFYIVPITLGIMSVSMISGSTFVAFGEPMPSFVLSIFRMFVVLLPLCYLFDSLYEYVGIFIAMSITNVIVGCISFFWIRTRTNAHRRQMSLRHEQAELSIR